MKHIVMIFIMVSINLPIMSQEPIKRNSGVLFPGVKKISDDLYVGKVGDQFFLAMERVTSANINMWQEYAHKQVVAGYRMTLEYLQNTDGSGHFESVLDEYKTGKIKPSNELWVAYASRTPVTDKAALYSEKNPSLEMFVTVVTSPEALITSHMGISRTIEAAVDLQQKPPRRIKHPDQSLHLHSFAAKVMKIRNPKRVYMITAPAVAMRTILLNKMPKGSVFCR